MANTLKIKRGAAATIPQGELAEPLFTTDTYDLYIGKGGALGNQRFQKYITIGTSTDFIKGDGTLDGTTYQATSEKGQNNGYASLDAGGKVPAAQLPNSVMEYKGTWNANTNNPTLADGTGNTGDVYIVSVGGTQNLGSGSITFEVGDWVMYNGAIWQKSTNSNAVVSVNGQTGVVTITFDQLSPMTTLGDIIYGGASGAGTRLAGNTTSTKKFLIQTGDGTNSAAPSWGSIAAGDVPTLNQNTTGSAATLTTARTLTIGATGKTFDGSANVSWTLAEIGAAAALSGTINTIAYWDSASTIASLATATYPSLTELSYVKGVTSAIQTQIDAKEPTVTKGNLTEATSSVLTITGGTGAVIGSGTTIAVANAGAAQNGVVTTGTQTFAGAKTFTGQVTISDKDLYVTNITGSGGANGNIYISNQRSIFWGTSGSTTFLAGNNATGDITLSSTTATLTGALTGTKLSMTSSITSGAANTFSVTQTQRNGTDTGDSLISASHSIVASSASNQLVIRAMSFGSNNNLTGGGVVTNYRVWNVASSTQTGTTTTHLDQIYIEKGTADGTVTNNRAIRINNMQGTNRAAFFVLDIGDGGTNNSYMVLGSDASATIPTGNWGIYQIQSGYNNYFNGKLLVKTTTDAGYALDVNGTGRFTGALTVTGASTLTGRVQGTEIGVTRDGADAIGDGPWYRWTNAATTRQMLTQLNASNGLTTWAYNGSTWSSIYTITQAGAATFSSSVTAGGRINSGNGGGGTASLNAQQLSGDDAALYALGVATAGSSKGIRILAGTNSSDYALNVASYANSPILYARGDGNVGIGTTSPATFLHVVDPSNGYDGRIKIGGNASSLGLVIDYDQNGDTATIIESNPTFTNTAALMKLRVDGDANPNQLVLTGGGNVGIGTASPSFISSGAETGVSILATGSNTAGINVASSNAAGSKLEMFASYTIDQVGLGTVGANTPIVFQTGTSGTERMRITSGGNVQVNAGTFYVKSSGTESSGYQLSAITMGYDATNTIGWITAGGASARTNLALQQNGGEVLIGTATDSGNYKLQVNGNTYTAGTITTYAPGASSIGSAWKFGGFTNTTVSAAPGYLLVEVAGTLYYVGLVSPL